MFFHYIGTQNPKRTRIKIGGKPQKTMTKQQEINYYPKQHDIFLNTHLNTIIYLFIYLFLKGHYYSNGFNLRIVLRTTALISSTTKLINKTILPILHPKILMVLLAQLWAKAFRACHIHLLSRHQLSFQYYHHLLLLRTPFSFSSSKPYILQWCLGMNFSPLKTLTYSSSLSSNVSGCLVLAIISFFD